MKTAVIGAGGLGGFFGAHLVRAGVDVTFVARGETVRVLQDRGLTILGEHGTFAVDGLQATDDPAGLGPVDLVLLCVKTYDLDGAIEAARPLVGPRTMVLPVQNGVAHVERLQAALGEQAVLGGLVMVNALRSGPGEIRHVGDMGGAQLEFGEWEQPASDRCRALEGLLRDAGLDAVAVDDIAGRMWWKLGVICGAAVFAVARGGKAKAWMLETREMVRRAVAEAVLVARARGIPLSDALPEEMVAIVENAPPTYRPSMLDDVEAGRPLEVEATCGYVSRLGASLGVPTPTNNFIYACLKPHVRGRGA